MITQNATSGEATLEFRIDETVPELVGFTVVAGSLGASLRLQEGDARQQFDVQPGETLEQELAVRVPCVRAIVRGKERLQFPYSFRGHLT